jgi:hypothetical protein
MVVVDRVLVAELDQLRLLIDDERRVGQQPIRRGGRVPVTVRLVWIGGVGCMRDSLGLAAMSR